MCAESNWTYLYSCEKFSKLETVPKKMMTTALFKTPYPLATAPRSACESFSRGKAAIGSAEVRMIERTSTSLEERASDKAELSKMKTMEKKQILSKVETMPRKLMMRMF